MKQATKNLASAGAKSPVRIRKEKWEETIVSLYLQGNNQEQIRKLAEEMTGGHKFSGPTIKKIIDKALDVWRLDKSQFITDQKVIELAKINNLENEYWEAYRRSCQEIKNVTQEKTADKDAGSEKRTSLKLSKVTNTKRQAIGDAKFLEGIQWCIKMRCEILGIETGPKLPVAPITGDVTINNVRNIMFVTRPKTATA